MWEVQWICCGHEFCPRDWPQVPSSSIQHHWAVQDPTMYPAVSPSVDEIQHHCQPCQGETPLYSGCPLPCARRKLHRKGWALCRGGGKLAAQKVFQQLHSACHRYERPKSQMKNARKSGTTAAKDGLRICQTNPSYAPTGKTEPISALLMTCFSVTSA